MYLIDLALASILSVIVVVVWFIILMVVGGLIFVFFHIILKIILSVLFGWYSGNFSYRMFGRHCEYSNYAYVDRIIILFVAYEISSKHTPIVRIYTCNNILLKPTPKKVIKGELWEHNISRSDFQ